MFWKDCIVVKLSGDTFDNALGLSGSKLFEPMEGKSMKEWVQIPFHYKKGWKRFAIASMQMVEKIKKQTEKSYISCGAGFLFSVF